MKVKPVAILLSAAMILMMASSAMSARQTWKGRMTFADTIPYDTIHLDSSNATDAIVGDSVGIVTITMTGPDTITMTGPDTLHMDSLTLAIFRHNQAVDDSLRLDSLNRAKSNGINSPVNFSAEDSMVYDAKTRDAYLYGSSKVDYEDMNLTSERVHVNLEQSMVDAYGVTDSTSATGLSGTPVFKMGSDEYVSDSILYNFKSKKGFIDNVYTEQQDGYIRSLHSKRDADGNLYLEKGKYTTCDEEHPDFYIALSRAKVRPGKDVVFGPAYLVVADVPLPLAIPYGFFPFTKSYSSGFIMPTYGDESSRGFYLRDGGYYFAINDRWDLKLLGEIYTKGSWGFTVTSNYRKRYRHSGSFLFNYQDTKNGDKGMPDFTRRESFKLQWQHNQDAKANPFRRLSASVNFATSSFERNNLSSMYNPQTMTQSTRTSSVNFDTQFSSLGMSIHLGSNIAQNMIDTTINLTLPDLTISVSRFFPFKRKKAAGKERWYEKINMSYSGHFSNSINAKEDQILHANIFKDWKNGFEHRIPINGSFTVFNYLNINPTINFNDRMTTSRVKRSWDEDRQVELADTTYGFYNIYDWNLSLGLSTTVYGFWTPNRKIFGDKINAIRHVFTPTVSFSYHPDFGASHYGYWDSYLRTDADGSVSLVSYTPFANSLYAPPGKGRSGSVTFDMKNNIEMKVRSEKDSTGFKKISIIDNLGASMSYNMADRQRPWGDLSLDIRLKWWKSYTFNMNASFATYAYELDDNGRPYIGTHTEYSRGRFGRFQGTSQHLSFTLTPEKIKKWFSGKDEKEESSRNTDEDDEGIDTDIESNVDDDMVKGQRGAKKKSTKAETDGDGYMSFSMPWSLTFSYGITMRENTAGKFNTKRMRYPYSFSQTLNVSGNIRLSDGWDIRFSSGYDFEYRKLSMTTASLSRDLHCFSMSCSVVLAPYTSYNFTFRCNAATLTDALKYDKRSGMSNAVQWY